MDITSIIAEYGAYYEKAGQNADRIKMLLKQGFDTFNYMTHIPQDDTIYKMGNATITRVLQPYKNTFSPTNSGTITANKIELEKIKIDLEENPDDYEGQWLGFLASESVKRTEWPFCRWFVEKQIIPQANDDMEELIFWGERVEPVAGNATPGNLLDSMNGIRLAIINGLSTGINQVTLNPLTAANIFDEVESFAEQIGEVYKRKDLNYFMSPTWADRYARDKRSNYPYYPQDDYKKVDFYPHKVIGLPCMEGSDIIFTTPKENFLYVTKKAKNMTKIDMQENDRTVHFLSDFWAGVGFGINSGVWAYVPEGSLSGSGSGS